MRPVGWLDGLPVTGLVRIEPVVAFVVSVGVLPAHEIPMASV